MNYIVLTFTVLLSNDASKIDVSDFGGLNFPKNAKKRIFNSSNVYKSLK